LHQASLTAGYREKQGIRMAYAALASSGKLSPEPQISGDSQLADSPALGREEWSVVEFARNDGLWSLNPDGFMQRLTRTLFGVRPPQPLANERLEALRRFAVIAWHRGTIGAAGHARDLIAAGFSCNAVRQVLDFIDRQRKIDSWPRGLA
jgi:hypothetical protein